MRVIRFTADWCQPCKMMAKVIDEVKPDIPIEVIDIDSNSDIALEYGIRTIPTLVMLDGNTEVKRSTGVLKAEELRNWLS